MTAYISEIDVVEGFGSEFVEIVAPAGTDMSGFSIYIYSWNGAVSHGPLSLGAVENTIAGQDVYTVDGCGGLPDVGWSDSVALVDDSGSATQFISFYGNTVTAFNGPAAGMTSTDIGSHGLGDSLHSSDGGLTLYHDDADRRRGALLCTRNIDRHARWAAACRNIGRWRFR